MKVCAIFYGHPGVFVYPSHISISKARKEGYRAKMLPAISAEDCLFADLGIDPGDYGCQAYEASQYLFYKHRINTYAALILWQIGVAGDVTLKKLTAHKVGLCMLKEKLSKEYPASHPVILYEASRLPIMQPRIETISIGILDNASVNTMTTLYVAPLEDPKLDNRFCDKWNIDTKQLASQR
ncbi:MAG: SAM-dependent methyltransferase, partial [Kangiellaceae bacterium]|nr:SAM-dependent methyltransferase [Kangiellaceae bacterium]